MTDLREAIAETRDLFRDLVWPVWKASLGADSLISTEGSEKPLERTADLAGVDAFFARKRNGTLVPLASRIEFAWAAQEEVSRQLDRTFTIRSARLERDGWNDNSELRRLLDACADPVSRRYLPYRTFQSLVSKDRTRLLFTSSVCTQALGEYARALIEQGRDKPVLNKVRDRYFLRIKVDDLRAGGVKVETRP